MYSAAGPAKRKRALVETNSPRDNRMGLRRIARLGGLQGLPKPTQPSYPELSPDASKTPAAMGQSTTSQGKRTLSLSN
jgi:hypothetical protein